MRFQPRKLAEQVVVITGATSGIGLVTARLAAKRGAKLVLAARNERDLEELSAELGSKDGSRVVTICADVVDKDQVQKIADVALEKFGRVDTWVNNAGLSIYGKLTEMPLDEKRRVFDVNFWGTVNGCRSAVKAMKEKGGVIVNVGSLLSDRAIPLQGIYCATKHAVKAYTESLRMELEAEGIPIALSLVKPAAIDTPYTIHAGNYMDRAPTHTPPVYAPEVPARAILACAERPKRGVYAGGAARAYSIINKFAPRAMDLIMERMMMKEAQTKQTAPIRDNISLFRAPRNHLKSRGNYEGRVIERSWYTELSFLPRGSWIAAGIVGGLTAWVWMNVFARKAHAPTYHRIEHFSPEEFGDIGKNPIEDLRIA